MKARVIRNVSNGLYVDMPDLGVYEEHKDVNDATVFFEDVAYISDEELIKLAEASCQKNAGFEVLPVKLKVEVL